MTKSISLYRNALKLPLNYPPSERVLNAGIPVNMDLGRERVSGSFLIGILGQGLRMSLQNSWRYALLWRAVQ